ncbi:MAG: FecR domain-containing protein, partial [bacterium]
MRGKEEEIRLRVDTLFKVNSLDSDQTEVEMPTGKARFKIKRKLNRKKKQRRKFNVRTVTALIGVRGTEFVMGTSGASTSLLTLDGSVEMAAVAAPEIKVEVSIGEASKLDVGKAPTPPITVPPALQNSIVESDSADTFGEVSFPPAQDLEEAVAEQKEKEEAQKEEEQEEEEQEEEEQEEEEQEEE